MERRIRGVHNPLDWGHAATSKHSSLQLFFRDIVLPVCFGPLTLYDRTLQNQLVQELMGARSSVVKQESLAHYRSYRASSPQVVRFRAQ